LGPRYHSTTTPQVTTQNPSSNKDNIKTKKVSTFLNIPAPHGCSMKENENGTSNGRETTPNNKKE